VIWQEPFWPLPWVRERDRADRAIGERALRPPRPPLGSQPGSPNDRRRLGETRSLRTELSDGGLRLEGSAIYGDRLARAAPVGAGRSGWEGAELLFNTIHNGVGMLVHGQEETRSVVEGGRVGPPGTFVSADYEDDCARFLDELKQRLRAIPLEQSPPPASSPAAP
jgi:hypothetical protein